MKTIFKYPLEITDKQLLKVRGGIRVLSIQFQGEVLCAWVLIDKDNVRESTFEISIVGTGRDFETPPFGDRYFTSIQQHGGALIWHIFIKQN